MLIGTPEFRPGVFPAFLDLCIGVAVAIPFPGLRNRMLRPHSPHETGARRRARPMMPRHDKIHVRHPAIEQKGLLPDPDVAGQKRRMMGAPDRKSTRLNSSHSCATRMPSSA